MTLPAGAYTREGVAYTAEGAMIVQLAPSSTIDSPTFTGVASFAAGTIAAPSVTLTDTVVGWYRQAANNWAFTNGTNGVIRFANGLVDMGSSVELGWHSGNTFAGTTDYRINRIGGTGLGFYGATTASGMSMRRYGGNAGYVEWGSVSENLTLSTGGTTTDTAANLLPADSYIESVTGRVTTTITTATDWKLGDASTAGRFCAAQSGAQLTAGATVVGLVHCDVTGAGGPRQTAAAKVRVTTTGTPGAGAIRITSYYRTFVAPTS